MKKLLAILLITSALFSCSKSSDTASAPLLPLTVGNTWNYSTYTYVYSNYGTSNTTTSVSSSVTGTISYNGNTYYSVSNNSNIAYRNIDNNTVEQYDGVNPPSIAFQRVAKDSDVVAYYLNGSYYGIKTPQDINGFSSIRNTRVIPNGSTSRDSINYFLCPGVGLVRNEHWYKSTADNRGYYLLTRQDLISYTLK